MRTLVFWLEADRYNILSRWSGDRARGGYGKEEGRGVWEGNAVATGREPDAIRSQLAPAWNSKLIL